MKYSRVLLAAADQGVSSIANTAFALIVAYSASGSEEYGLFAMIHMAVFFCNGFYLAATVEPISTTEFASHEALARVLGWQWVLWAAYLVAASLFSALFGSPALAFAVATSAALSASSYIARSYFIAVSRPERALALDFSWLVLQLAGFSLVHVTGTQNIALLCFVWGVSGIFSVFFVLKKHELSLEEISKRPLVRWGFGREFLMNNSPIGLLIIALGVLSGAAAVGAVRFILFIIGPINTVIVAARYAFVPYLSRREVSIGLRDYWGLQFMHFLVAGILALIVWFLFPVLRDSVGWDEFTDQSVFLFLLINKIGFASVYASIGFMRAIHGEGTERLALLSAVTTIFFGLLGIIFLDALGLAFSLSVSALLIAGMWARKSIQSLNRPLAKVAQSR